MPFNYTTWLRQYSGNRNLLSNCVNLELIIDNHLLSVFLLFNSKNLNNQLNLFLKPFSTKNKDNYLGLIKSQRNN